MTCKSIPVDVERMVEETREEMMAKDATLSEATRGFERRLIETTLVRVNWDRERAAQFLGVRPRILDGKVRSYGIS